MAIRLQPPNPFDFKQPDEWSRWKRRFEQFRSASGLSGQDQARQVSTLLYSLGDEAEDVLTSTNITAEGRTAYDTVVAKFDEYFKVRRNVIFERARFNRRCQRDDESAEQYITTLYSLIETCEYGNLKEEMLRDRLVVGIKDIALSERLQLDAELSLEKAKTAIRQKEAVKEHRSHIRGDGTKKDPIVLEELGSRKSPRKGVSHKTRGRPQQRKPPGSRAGNAPAANCTRCGRARHPDGDNCPAKSATCHKCNRKGHYSVQCFSKTTAAASATHEMSLDTTFLDTVTKKEGKSSKSWYTDLLLEGQEISFKLDTGAEVTAISEQAYRSLKGTALEKPSKALYGPAHHALDVQGQFTASLVHREHSTSQTIFVVRGLKTNLLGLPAIRSLELLRMVAATEVSGEEIRSRFKNVFSGLGTLGEEYTIQLQPDARPLALYTPRSVPMPLRSKVQEELDRMEAMGVISKVSEPTPWCAGMVVVPKKSGAVRICVDLKPLNESVLREVHPIPKVDETLAQLAGAAVFSKLDANSGFWQIPLAEPSRRLTTFITPFGRYFFNKLPFGISSAPELFQRRMSKLLDGLEGVVCLMDDVLIFGVTTAEHDIRLIKVLERLQSAGVTLNPTKCEFNKSSVKFLGHLVDKDGIRADPEKTSAILRMEAPRNITEVRRFMGMINQLGKFSPSMAELSQPIRELLSTKRTWTWGPDQERAFSLIKLELTRPTVLALYNTTANTKVSADASSFGLGAVLLQQSGDDDTWKPVSYASRSMSETEQRYAQIEKEALAVTWACEKFADYILGRTFHIESDHKPLIPLLSSKHLDRLPPRVLRFRLRLARFSYTIEHVPGKLLYTADTLSRAPTSSAGVNSLQFDEEVELFVHETISTLPASKHRLETYRQAQAQDEECRKLLDFCRNGWPKKSTLEPHLVPYWKERGSLTLCDQLLLHGKRIVIPQALRKMTTEKIHEGHQGMERCRMRAQASVWWPGVVRDVKDMVQRCPTCVRDAFQRKEPLMPSSLPDFPWQVVGTDLFEMKGDHYLLVVDYFSRYPEVLKMSTTTSSAVINALKSVFSRHGIPEVVRSDNGPQYASQDFTQFAESYGFQHSTSSPYYPQSNGQAERAVQSVKRLLIRSQDPFAALLGYRATPFPWCNLSPSQLSMGRRIRTTVPQISSQLIPDWPYLPEFRQRNMAAKRTQKRNFDQRHRVQSLPDIPANSEVWVTSGAANLPVRGRITASTDTPRSYIVETPTGQIQRNRQHLNPIPQSDATLDQEDTQEQEEPRRIITRSQTGTKIGPPERLN